MITLLKTIVDVRKKHHVKNAREGITNILKLEMNSNYKLFDIYVHDIEDLAFEIVITEIMKSVADVEKNDVNLDEMLKESTEKEEALEDAVIDSFIDFLNGITNIFND